MDLKLRMDSWVDSHMNTILIAIEVLWVAAFALVFVFYFVIRKRVRGQRDRQKQTGIAENSPSKQRSRTSPTGNSSVDS
jgi:cbb3-type cytochrome oxidase subunit 3